VLFFLGGWVAVRPTPKFKGMQQLGVFVEGGSHQCGTKEWMEDIRKNNHLGWQTKKTVNDGRFDIYHINW